MSSPPASPTRESCLQANLACFGERNADVAGRLAEIASRDDLVFSETPQGVPAASLDGRPLCSRHRPLDEAVRLIEHIDLLEHAVVVVFGFGSGYHVRALAERLEKTGLIIVVEPDLALLRAVLEHVDHSQWMRKANVVWVSDPTDRGALGRKLDGAEAIIAQGVEFLEHPASRDRLAEAVSQFAPAFSDFVTAAKTTFVTTLVRSLDTVRNFMLNVDHYAAGHGIAELKDAAKGYPAIVVSAGPSLRRNLHLLTDPAVRERCVIIAVQTMLKPLLAAGVRPHFITALDYHEISARFYEDLTPQDVRGITLIAEAKVHPAVIDAFPGAVRCCGSTFLDRLLGPLERAMGEVPPGATVAHLCVYLARHLGCDPVILVGQDLGFTDGLYYTPGTAIHDVWAPELNPFNTIEMMEWQRIARHRTHLQKVQDVNGRSIFTDMQMVTYLQQFERDFATFKAEGVTVIDATEGGVLKQHTTPMPLAVALERHASRALPIIPIPPSGLDEKRLRSTKQRLGELRRDVAGLRDLSSETAALLRRMIEDQGDPAHMQRHFARMDRCRKDVERRMETFHLVNYMNQLGVFRRLRADRRLHMQRHLEGLARQRAQLERDLDNVTWIADAAAEMLDLLADATRVLEGERVAARSKPACELMGAGTVHVESQTPPARIAALVPCDPQRSGLGFTRSLAQSFSGRSILQATLERLGRSNRLESIILIAPHEFDLEPLIDRRRIALPVHIERCDGSPFGPEQEAVAAARWWAETCWRGGIAGMSCYDEVLCPRVMAEAMQNRGLTAALLVGPDWPLVCVTGEAGCDTVIARHLEHPQQHKLVFTQAPPGLCGCVVSASIMSELVQRNRLCTIGALLVYQPHVPQHDPIARDANVQIDHRIRRAMVRAIADSPRAASSIESCASLDDPREIVATLEGALDFLDLPRHVIVELNTDRQSSGRLHGHPFGPISRPRMSRQVAERLFEQLGASRDIVVTFDGLGDPLLHPHFDEFIRLAKACSVRGVEARTELLADRAILDRLLECGVDVISVDLHADRAAIYEIMMGRDRFKHVLLNLEYIAQQRRTLTAHSGTAGFALPWIVPRLQRRAETYEDINSFFDRWQHVLGAAVIEGPPPFDARPGFPRDTLAEAITPPRVMLHQLRRRMSVLSDGSVPVSEIDLPGKTAVGNVLESSIDVLWQRVRETRERLRRERGESAEAMRTFRP